IPVERSMNGSGAPGNSSRAAASSPPCSSAGAPRWEAMAVTLTLLALLFELMIGYPDRLLRSIGHPVIWMGSLIGALDARLNRDTAGPVARRVAGGLSVLILIAVTGFIAVV